MKAKFILTNRIFLSAFLILLLSISGISYAVMLDKTPGKQGSPSSVNAIIKTRISNGAEEAKPLYVPGEVIVKLKQRTFPQVLYAQSYSERASSENSVLSKLKLNYNLEDERPVFSSLHKQLKAQNLSQARLDEKIQLKAMNNKAVLPSKPVSSKPTVDLLPIYVLNTDQDVLSVCEKLKKDPDVEYAEPNYIVKVQAIPNDPYYSSSGSWGQSYDDLWGIKKIHCEESWGISQGEGVVVAVIDTGVDYNHPDLAENIWTNSGEIPDNGIDDDQNGYIDDVKGWDFAYEDNDPMDGYGHGTHVSATIAAVGNNNIGVIGVAPGARIMAVKGLGDNGSGSSSKLADCVYYAADNGADILNNSWGGTFTSQLLIDAFHYAESEGCVAIAAAGNESANVLTSTPANIDTVIAVAAIDYADKKASFSNFGTKVDVSAPGVDVLSCYPQTLPHRTSKVIVTMNSDGNNELPADSLEYSPDIPAGGLNGQVLYAGLGYPDDFAGQDFTNKIALIERGELYFKDKVQNAYAAGAIGAIIYNNESGNFSGTLQETSEIPAVSISMEDGEYMNNLINAGATTVTISAVDLGSYEAWSGTSMACPHVAGLAALIKMAFPTDSPHSIRSRIIAGADSIDSLNPGFENLLGTGRINTFSSLTVTPKPVLKIIGIEHDALPGKTSNIFIHLKNYWHDALGVTATLSTTHPKVIIEDGNAVFGDILSGQTKINRDNPFIVSFASDIPFGETVNFKLTLSGQGSSVNTYDFVVPIAYFSDVGAVTNLPLSDFLPVYALTQDYNNDGYADLFFAGFLTAALYKNCQNDSFIKVDAEAGVNDIGMPFTALFIDIDNDGDEDLIIGTWCPVDESSNKLFLNNGNGTFSDIAVQSGIGNVNEFLEMTALDYNNDGYIDIFGNTTGGIVLLRNNRNSTFTNVISETGISLAASAEFFMGSIIALDYDNDGDQDLLLSLRQNGPQVIKLYRNNGDGTFADVTNECGIDTSRGSAYGIAAGDYDNDGYIDIFLTGFPNYDNRSNNNVLYRNNHDGTFIDVTELSGNVGLGTEGSLWGNDFFDYDNDGDLDLFLTNNSDGGNVILTNALYNNNGNGTFTNVTDIAFPREANPSSSAACMGDYNNDGALDIYAPGLAGTFLRNGIGTKNNYIKLKLEGTISNRDGYGARIYVKTGALTQLRESHTSPVEPRPIHFGLKRAMLIDEIEVDWPSGIKQRLNNVTPNQLLTITEPEIIMPVISSINPKMSEAGDTITISGKNFGQYVVDPDYNSACDIDHDGDVDASDFGVFRHAYGTHLGDPLYAQICDFDCDGDVDGQDLDIFRLTMGKGISDSCVLFSGGLKAYVLNWSDANIICVVPYNASSGNISVVTDAGQSNGVYFTLFTVPTPPGNFIVAGEPNAQDGYLHLSWKDTSDNETGFKIERSTDGVIFTQIAMVNANMQEYIDRGVVLRRLYYYRARAYNLLGDSQYSSVAIVPPAPALFAAAVISNNRIDLSWKDMSNNESGFIIMRADGFYGSYLKIATLAANAAAYSDTNVSANVEYHYTICAYNGNTGYSQWNSPISATTSLPPVPQDLQAVAVSQSKIRLTWRWAEYVSQECKIERGLDGSSFTEIATVDNAYDTYYDDTNLSANSTTYYYRARGHNGIGYSEYSNIVSVTVVPNNQAPILAPIGNKAVSEASILQFTISATDPDGDPLTYSSSNLPEGATFTNRIFIWTPTYAQAGSYTITFTASDGQLSDTETITITVNNINRPPELDPIGSKTTDENKLLTFTVSAKDPDNDKLYFEAEDIPDGAKFDLDTNTFTWTPTYEQSGRYKMTFKVSDGQAEANESITITVKNVDRPPVLDPIGNKIIDEAKALEFTVKALDPDGDPVILSAKPLPPGSTFDNGAFRWTPTYDQAGLYQVTFFADSTTGITPDTQRVSETIKITVNNVNRSPVVVPIGNKTIDEGKLLTFTVSAKDPDSDKLNYSASNLPKGATLDSTTGLFSWKPTYYQAGAYKVTFTVSDGSLTVSDIVTITVRDVNGPPQIEPIGDKTVKRREWLRFKVKATDPDNDPIFYYLTDKPQGAHISIRTGEFAWRPNINQAGSFKVTFIAKDSKGNQSSETITITVPNSPPVLSPVDDKRVRPGHTLSFRLIAHDPDRMDDNRLRFYADSLPKGATLHYVSGIFHWRPSKNQAGTYRIKLGVRDPFGLSDERTVTIYVK